MLAQASGKHKAYTHADVSGIGVVETFSELMARTHQEQAGNQARHGIIKSLGAYAHGLRQSGFGSALQALQPRLGVIFIVYIADGLLRQVLLFLPGHDAVSI